MNRQADIDFAGKTRAAATLIAVAIALAIHAPAGAQSGQPKGRPHLQQSTCGAHAASQRELKRANIARLRKAKENLLAAAVGGHRGPVPEKTSPTQLACSDLAYPRVGAARGG